MCGEGRGEVESVKNEYGSASSQSTSTASPHSSIIVSSDLKHGTRINFLVSHI